LTGRIDEIVSGIPFEEIFSTGFQNNFFYFYVIIDLTLFENV